MVGAWTVRPNYTLNVAGRSKSRVLLGSGEVEPVSIVRAPINGEVLRQGIADARTTSAAVARRLNVKPEVVTAWESSVSRPTVNQLRSLSRMLRMTPATFFLEEAPPPAMPIVPEFRSHADPHDEADVAREMAKAIERRSVMLDLAPNPPTAWRSVKWEFDWPVAEAARRLREALGIGRGKTFNLGANASTALNAWIELLSRTGVLIFQVSRIDKNKVLGISVFHDAYPIVILNGASSPEVRVFTLAHELGHLVSHSGGLCTLWEEAGAEVQCNEFAAEFLMPKEDFEIALENDDPLEAIARLAGKFKVSQSAVVVRLRTLGFISQETMLIQLGIARRLADLADERSLRQRQGHGGPPHHRVHLRNLGRHYFDTVTDALDVGRISLLDASYYLDAKLPTLDRMRAERVMQREVVNEILA